MIIEVKIHPGSSQKKIVKKNKIYHVYIHSLPEKGKANKESIKILSKYFNIGVKSIIIQNGKLSKTKIIELTGK